MFFTITVTPNPYPRSVAFFLNIFLFISCVFLFFLSLLPLPITLDQYLFIFFFFIKLFYSKFFPFILTFFFIFFTHMKKCNSCKIDPWRKIVFVQFWLCANLASWSFVPLCNFVLVQFSPVVLFSNLVCFCLRAI